MGKQVRWALFGYSAFMYLGFSGLSKNFAELMMDGRKIEEQTMKEFVNNSWTNG